MRITKGSGEPAHSHTLARTYAVRYLKRYAKAKCHLKNLLWGLAKGLDTRTETDLTESSKDPILAARLIGYKCPFLAMRII